MIFHFPNSPLCHRRYVVCATIRAFGTARVTMISLSTSSQTYISVPWTLYLTWSFCLRLLQPYMRMRDYLCDNDLNESLQFAYKKHHSCETALLRVQNDILKSIDNKQCVVLLLLDLWAAFDTVNHKILLHRLRSRFVVNKFKSKLKAFLFKRIYELS